MARTQMRLDAITGSMAALEPASVAQGAGPLNFVAADLEDILGGFAQAVANIHGSTAFTSQEPGKFEHATSKFIGILSASSHIQGAANLTIAADSDLKGYTRLRGTTKVDLLGGGDGALVFNNANKEINSNDKVKFDGNDLVVASAKVSDLTDTRVVFAGPSGSLVDSANMVFDGTDLTVASAKVSDLTATRVVFAGASGALVDDAQMTYAAGTLTVSGSTYSKSAAVAADLTVGGNATITGDLNVMGSTTTIDTQNLLVKDAKIVISSGSLVDGAGIYLDNDSAGENIRWATADGGKWIASDKLAADTLQALDLTSAIVWADASGNLVEISNQDLADAMEARLAAGTGVHISEAGALITVAIGQPVETTSVVTFAAVTGSNLTASRLMASDANKVMVSADLSAWVAGTANQVSVADDLDGTITLSLPQNIDTNADVEFDTLKLGDYAADAGKAYKVGASGSIVPAAWDEFVAIEANVGLELVQNGFKAEIGLAQDIRTSASPEFAALNLGSYGDLVASGSDFKVMAAADLFLADAQGSFKLSEVAGDWTSYVANFGSVSLVEALNSLAGGSVAGKGKWVKTLAADIAGGQYTFLGADALVGSSAPALGAAPERTEIYLNGQLMVAGADYTVTGAMVDFSFDLKADDVIVAVIR